MNPPPTSDPVYRTAALVVVLAITLCLMAFIVLVLFGPVLTQ